MGGCQSFCLSVQSLWCMHRSLLRLRRAGFVDSETASLLTIANSSVRPYQAVTLRLALAALPVDPLEALFDETTDVVVPELAVEPVAMLPVLDVDCTCW